jgi:hypothetical protein
MSVQRKAHEATAREKAHLLAPSHQSHRSRQTLPKVREGLNKWAYRHGYASRRRLDPSLFRYGRYLHVHAACLFPFENVALVGWRCFLYFANRLRQLISVADGDLVVDFEPGEYFRSGVAKRSGDSEQLVLDIDRARPVRFQTFGPQPLMRYLPSG